MAQVECCILLVACRLDFDEDLGRCTVNFWLVGQQMLGENARKIVILKVRVLGVSEWWQVCAVA